MFKLPRGLAEADRAGVVIGCPGQDMSFIVFLKQILIILPVVSITIELDGFVERA